MPADMLSMIFVFHFDIPKYNNWNTETYVLPVIL